jgi:hypothetical protein
MLPISYGFRVLKASITFMTALHSLISSFRKLRSCHLNALVHVHMFLNAFTKERAPIQSLHQCVYTSVCLSVGLHASNISSTGDQGFVNYNGAQILDVRSSGPQNVAGWRRIFTNVFQVTLLASRIFKWLVDFFENLCTTIYYDNQ